ncbi:MAG TPA: gliding motility-associated C-terminal domain-containing protein, partial [Cytophagaceae bacterium]|nr:gliding motility-associated C-terminal domain-containing protein [Cytophagaceae bacterium]
QTDTVFSNSYTKNATDQNDEGTYTVKVGGNNCYYFIQSVEVEFSSLHNIIVYELVSPDGDGKNDFFYIQNIEKHQDSEVHVLNTWNQTVFKTNNYTNDWSGGDLPGGTYYYVVKIPSLNKLLKGALYLKK